ncbi:MAG TPA: ABC transporter permease [Longimicrobiales bacterium]|nr:ABC transporter permease [Longimicrobiales bacterium]
MIPQTRVSGDTASQGAAEAVLPASPAADPARPAPRAAAGARRGAVADLRQIVRELVQSRDLLVQLTLRDIRIRYKQAVLGFAWALVLPVVVVLAGFAVRLAIAYTAGRPIDNLQFAGMAIKAVPWAFFVGCIGSATPTLTANTALVTKVYFPREVLPLATMLAQSFDSAIGLAVVTLVMAVIGVGVSAQLLWAPVVLALLWIFTAAAALFLSCANLFFRDVKYMVQVGLSFGIFFTPVLVDVAMFGPKWGPRVMLNPIAPLLEGLRLSVVEHHNLLQPLRAPAGYMVWHPWQLGYSAAWALGGLVLAALVFHRAERRFAELV